MLRFIHKMYLYGPRLVSGPLKGGRWTLVQKGFCQVEEARMQPFSDLSRELASFAGATFTHVIPTQLFCLHYCTCPHHQQCWPRFQPQAPNQSSFSQSSIQTDTRAVLKSKLDYAQPLLLIPPGASLGTKILPSQLSPQHITSLGSCLPLHFDLAYPPAHAVNASYSGFHSLNALDTLVIQGLCT